LELAHYLQETKQAKVYYFSLTSLPDWRQLLPSLAHQLGLLSPEADEASVWHALTLWFERQTSNVKKAGKSGSQPPQSPRLVLVLDQFEHLVEGAHLLANLLSACPTLKLIVTSQTRLELSGEQLFPVRPLSLPPFSYSYSDFVPIWRPTTSGATGELEAARSNSNSSGYRFGDTLAEIEQSSAVQLLMASIRRYQPDFWLDETNAGEICWICQRLDGLPLALELVAAKCEVVSLTQIAQSLEGDYYSQPRLNILEPLTFENEVGGGTPPPSLRSNLEISYQLLSRQEQQLLFCLAVFEGGATLEAIQIVCTSEDDTSLPPSARAKQRLTILPALTRLLSQSWLVRLEADRSGLASGETRLGMLSIIQEFVLAHLLQEQVKAETRDNYHYQTLKERHALYYLELAKQVAAGLNSSKQSEWLARLKLEKANFKAALCWLGATFLNWRNEPSLPLLGQGLSEQRERLWYSLELASWLGVHLWLLDGRVAEGRDWLENLIHWVESRANVSESEEETLARAPVLARSEWVAGSLARLQGEVEIAHRFLSTSYNHYQQLANQGGTAASLLELGHLWQVATQYEEAAKCYEESHELYQQLGDKVGVAVVKGSLGALAENQGDYAKARRCYERSQGLAEGLGLSELASSALVSLGRLSSVQGKYGKASTYYYRGLTLARQAGNLKLVSHILNNLGVLAKNQGFLKEAKSYYTESLELCQKLGDKPVTALVMANLAQIADLQEEYARARYLAEESLSLCQELGESERKRQSHARTILGSIAYHQGEFEEGEMHYRESFKLSQAIGYERGGLVALEGLALVMGAKGQLVEAAELWGVSAALREAKALPLPPVEQSASQRELKRLSELLGKETFEEHYRWGQLHSSTTGTFSSLSASKLEQLAASPAGPVPTLLKVASGNLPLPLAPLSSSSVQWASLERLTAREQEILGLMAKGLSTKQISQQLYITYNTTRTHLFNLYQKLGVSSRAQALKVAEQLGLI
jgi:DNA-binding CsgD family transcriptional regulator